VRVLIVDDHAVFRARLQDLLTVEAFDVVGAAGTAADGLALAEGLRPDVVLLDVMLPDVPGFDVVVPMQKVGAAVVLISSRDRRDYGSRVRDCGADGFLGKGEISGSAIRAALA
jgi:DNA-binding NarL/FixJ family response regulator